MEDLLSNGKAALSLFELNNIVKEAISSVLPETCWVIAEIADMKLNQKGHCYLDLVEKAHGRLIAQVKSNIWAYDFRRLSAAFQAATRESLRAGMKVLFFVSVNFHEVYGLSLNVRDIDPAYSVGEMALKKKEVIERLTKEGLISLNKSLSLPIVPQKIAVISSPTAAGYGDFFEHLDRNPYGYSFAHVLFPAVMQGAGAEGSIISALQQISLRKDLFDLVVIIRGGGSVIDLNCFDNYNLASVVAKMPLPVITGIGHEKDDTVVDMTAHTKMKTPTAVAEFLISGLRSFEENITEIQKLLTKQTERLIMDNDSAVDALTQRLGFVSIQLTTLLSGSIEAVDKDLRVCIRQLLFGNTERLDGLERVVKLLDPVNVLRRGYSITQYRGKILKTASDLRAGNIIDTTLFVGSFRSCVMEKQKEAIQSEQDQTVDLFSSIEGA